MFAERNINRLTLTDKIYNKSAVLIARDAERDANSTAMVNALSFEQIKIEC